MDWKLLIQPVAQRWAMAKRSLAFRARTQGKGIRIDKDVALTNVTLDDFVNISHDAQLTNACVGKRTSIGRYTKVRDARIGSYCSISWDVTIGAVSHPMDHLSSHAFVYREQFGIVREDKMQAADIVEIGNDVWIGCDCVIMPGVKIGDGSVIGANSVVTRNVEPYSVVSGIPAKMMRKRFSSEIIETLTWLNWWNWDDDKLRENISLFEQPVTNDLLADFRLEE